MPEPSQDDDRAERFAQFIKHDHLRRVDHPARKRVEPYRQGDLDRHCSIYALVNAFQLAIRPHSRLSRSRAMRVFTSSIERILKAKEPFAVLARGLCLRRTLSLASHMAEALSDDRLNLTIERCPDGATTIADLFAWVEESLLEGMPVVVRLTGDMHHWTVIAGLDRRRVYLIDSGDLKSVWRKDCGLKQAVHILTPQAMFRVRATYSEPQPTPEGLLVFLDCGVTIHG